MFLFSLSAIQNNFWSFMRSPFLLRKLFAAQIVFKRIGPHPDPCIFVILYFSSPFCSSLTKESSNRVEAATSINQMLELGGRSVMSNSTCARRL